MRKRAWAMIVAGLLAGIAPATPAAAQQFFGPGFGGAVGPVGLAPPAPAGFGYFIGGGAYPSTPNVLAYSYGGVGPFGQPAFGRVIYGSNVIGYSNSAYSSFSNQYGGLGVPVLSNRTGGYSATRSGFSVMPGGVGFHGASSGFQYAQPGLVPGLAGPYPFAPGGTAVSYPLGTYGSYRRGGMTFLPQGGY